MKKIHWIGSALALGLLCFAAQPASATLTYSAVVGGAPTGVKYVNFDDLTVRGGDGTSTPIGGGAGVGVYFSGGANVYDLTAINTYQSGHGYPPYLSNNNGVLFGDSTNGLDTTPFLWTPPAGSINLYLPEEERYIGFLWGSVDRANKVEFYNNSTLVGTIMGSDVQQDSDVYGINGTLYLNVNSSLGFNRLVLSTPGGGAMEVDNLSYNIKEVDITHPVVPEPSTWALMAIGLGLGGLMLHRRTGTGLSQRI